MNIFKTIKEIKHYLSRYKAEGKSIGFVPTMGALHLGHLSLLREAKSENDIVACSIFVNPLQFNNLEDLEKYPRNIEEDSQKLKEVNCDCLFYPTLKEMYPEPVKTVFDFGHLDNVMEGKYRPGHFTGVAIVVKKLFEITEPDNSYFGEKDFQQLTIIKSLVKKCDLKVNIVSCPTIRETDGLAMSSRNINLTKEERVIAPVIYQTLKIIKENAGSHSPEETINWAKKQLSKNKKIQVEYIEIVDTQTLLPIKTWKKNQKSVVCVALFLGKVRLIDNILIFS